MNESRAISSHSSTRHIRRKGKRKAPFPIIAPGSLAFSSADGLRHLVDGEPKRQELRFADIHTDFPFCPAEDEDLGDAFYLFQPFLQQCIACLGKLHQSPGRGGG